MGLCEETVNALKYYIPAVIATFITKTAQWPSAQTDCRPPARLGKEPKKQAQQD